MAGVLLTLAHINKCCKSYFPTTQIACNYGFTYIKSETTVPRFLLIAVLSVISEIYLEKQEVKVNVSFPSEGE